METKYDTNVAELFDIISECIISYCSKNNMCHQEVYDGNAKESCNLHESFDS